MLSARWCGWWLCLVVGCGGAVEGGSSEERIGDPQPSGKPATSENDDADTELGACELGRKEDYREDCAWVADGRCYDTREMACNCACPRSGNSQCASGFDDGPDGHVWVTCD